MNIKQKYFLENYKEKQKMLGYQLVNIFFISEEIDLIDNCLCDPLSLIIDSNVYWYMDGERAVVCVLEKYVDEAIEVGKKIIIQNFSTMGTEYNDKNRRSPVLDDYSVIATFNTDDPNGLSSWCNNIDTELVVKTNTKGYQCVLTKEPLEFTSKIQNEYKRNPFRSILNFDFFKI